MNHFGNEMDWNDEWQPTTNEERFFLPPGPPPGGHNPMPPFWGPQPPMPQPPMPQPPTNQTPQPMGPPPAFTPAMNLQGHNSGSQHIRMCLYRNTYIWMNDRSQFWFFPTFTSRHSVVGFRWGRFGWIPSTLRRHDIFSFQCF